MFQHFLVFNACNPFSMKYVSHSTHCVKRVDVSDFIMSFNTRQPEIQIHKMYVHVMPIFMDKEMWLKSRRQISAAYVLQALLLTRESNHTRIVKCIRPHILFLLAIIRRSQPNAVHQSVSVGHYLLHPNNREFNQGTRPALANHRLRALLLTPDLSTHTMFSPYISAGTSASFFFPFKIHPKTARKQKLCLGANLSHEFFQNYS